MAVCRSSDLAGGVAAPGRSARAPHRLLRRFDGGAPGVCRRPGGGARRVRRTALLLSDGIRILRGGGPDAAVVALESAFNMTSDRLSDELFESAAGMAAATNYAEWTFSLFAPFVRGRVLEVGCGVGTFTKRLIATPAVSQVLSIDVSAAAVATCRRSVADPRLEVTHADVSDVNGRFDLVVCMN